MLGRMRVMSGRNTAGFFSGARYGQALGLQQAVVQHMRALPHGAVADALATV